ncbi:type II toxin-antitoxin system HipA family toxin YjjJ [Rugamonas sp. CCM 8940]|uniref:type II toxin-antitoxin system HipA family toxin YjjJ n=1 Tax=Rugamonas sp. CCM 8940 TaxID=2765359 RepID=UPI0018F29E7E|nr:type II toxin-antitoxin system HipA family toxin YjjJ [Rugamonas sp. CCM 8940]MBJ7310360.1 type II toxin-antitoxin system HipA family toxin YjjJ [Rugamonas sp. CCM 8940]
MAYSDNLFELQRLLKDGPRETAGLLADLKISQPTFSRLWPGLQNGIALGATRRRRYALRRQIAGVPTPLPLFRVAEDGQAAPLGQLEVLEGGWFALTFPAGHDYLLFQGMPFFLRDLRPQGFLGRMAPAQNKDLDLPDDILRWSDDHVLKYLSRRSEHAAGDIVVGNESYARFLASPQDEANAPLAASRRQSRYPRLAEQAMQGDPPGSSAGGEQPKFTQIIARDDQKMEHVIVKFSPRTDSAGGRRWGDLLICEHLALDTLRRHNIAAATTSIVEAEQRVFLEVLRFDRHGQNGRLPMLTFAALDGELGMLDQSWTAVARELGRQQMLSQADQRTVEILDLFGALIGNTDRHHGNIAAAWALQGPHRLLPCYDMLPMLYRPNQHGEVVPREWAASSVRNMELRHLERCYAMAMDFWQAVFDDPRIEDEFKRLMARHVAIMAQLNPRPPR